MSMKLEITLEDSTYLLAERFCRACGRHLPNMMEQFAVALSDLSKTPNDKRIAARGFVFTTEPGDIPRDFISWAITQCFADDLIAVGSRLAYLDDEEEMLSTKEQEELEAINHKLDIMYSIYSSSSKTTDSYEDAREATIDFAMTFGY